MDRFLEALIRRRTTSDGVLEELFEDATAVAAAWHETDTPSYRFAFLLDERGAEVRRLLSERSVPCEEPVTLDDVEDAYAELLRAEPSPLYKALRRLDPGANPVRANEVRVACSSEGWGWTGDWGLEPFLVALLGSLENGSDELFASASRLAEARRARPDFWRLKVLLDAEDDAGIQIRAALRRAGRKVDTLVSWVDVKAASVVLDAKETAVYQAAADVELVGDGSRLASAIVALRGIVGRASAGGLDGVVWASLDRVLAAALPLAVKRQAGGSGLRLFDAQTLADAVLDSGIQKSYLYRFLKLLEDGDDDAREVRVKLAAVGLDAGTYPPATQGQVKSALADKRKAARDAMQAAKKRKVEDKVSPKRTRRGPLSGN